MKSLQIGMGNGSKVDVFLAHSWYLRLRGLLGRSLASNQALHISPCGSIHTMWMSYCIDVIYLDKSNKVIKIDRQVKPWRFSSCPGARSVIELKSGQAGKIGLSIGEVIKIPR